MLLAAVEAVIQDDGFAIPSPLAVDAVKCVTELPSGAIQGRKMAVCVTLLKVSYYP